MYFAKAFVVTHIVYRKTDPFEPLEGPYSSVCNGLTSAGLYVDTVQIPLENYDRPILIGKWKKEKKLRVPAFLGKIAPIKYVIDTLIVFYVARNYLSKNKKNKVIYIGIDPLSTLALVVLRQFMLFELAFYAVDFNQNRFANKIMQFLYEKADELASTQAHYVWAVCEGLADYKKKFLNVEADYIPNSNQYDPRLYRKGKDKRTGNKMCWTGSCITPRQFTILFSVLKKIQEVRPSMEFHFAPVGNHEAFEENCKKYGLKKWTVHRMHSRREFQEFATTCDVGVAVYDDKFGSTKFIEPLKIWDFLLCGLPFIISCEPSLGKAIKESGAAYLLKSHNKIPDDNSLKKFLDKKNLENLQTTCLQLAKEFDIAVQMKKSLKG